MPRRKKPRNTRTRQYRKLIVIATEGSLTERQYLNLQRIKATKTKVELIKSDKKSSPDHVLKRMRKRLNEKPLKQNDEAWLVVDKDQWSDDQLNKLCEWADQESNRGIVVSNPNFEYWLLLHFEDRTIASLNDCKHRLKRHLPNYSKQIHSSQISQNQILDAVERAKNRDNPPCRCWPLNFGSTMYKLMEKIME